MTRMAAVERLEALAPGRLPTLDPVDLAGDVDEDFYVLLGDKLRQTGASDTVIDEVAVALIGLAIDETTGDDDERDFQLDLVLGLVQTEMRIAVAKDDSWYVVRFPHRKWLH